jgi:hypothetical protein
MYFALKLFMYFDHQQYQFKKFLWNSCLTCNFSTFTAELLHRFVMPQVFFSWFKGGGVKDEIGACICFQAKLIMTPVMLCMVSYTDSCGFAVCHVHMLTKFDAMYVV